MTAKRYSIRRSAASILLLLSQFTQEQVAGNDTSV